MDPSNTSADITRLVVRHTSHAVLVELYLRDLQPVGYADGVVRLQTPHRTYQALAYYAPDDPGSVELSHGQVHVSCARMSAHFRPRRDKVRVRLPRTCLHDPRWVRVGASYTRFDGPDDPAPQGTFHDDALAVGEDAPPTTWSPRVRPAPPKPEPPLTLSAAYGWADRRAVGLRMTDGLARVEVAARRGVVIERVRAPFDSGVRVLGTRMARPDREIGGVLVHGWPTGELDWSRTLPARGAHLGPTDDGQDWLLLIGYEVTRPGRHLRPSIRIDYRVGDRHLTVVSQTPGLICAGRVTRHRPCEPTDGELGELGRADVRG
ncbi:hypothetical protein [Nocardioides aquiterrae]|uniref:Uncharacterized protein n=1 Tax=Nocardioides aquiterrae TaxID=203799 RepID=A0ABP4F7S7_9ACTN